MKFRPQQMRRRNTMLRELAEMLASTLKQHGVTAEAAQRESEELIFQLHRRWAGITFCFPKNDDIARKELERHIVIRYDGTNAEQLVREYGITESMIYSIIRKYLKQSSSN